MGKLSPTWVVITLGTRKYAINSAYVQSINELSTALFKEPYYGSTYVKGVYNIHNTPINVLDGRKIVGEKTIDQYKIESANKINELRVKHEAWLDAIEWELLTGDEHDRKADKTDEDLINFINTFKTDDEKCKRLIDKIRQPLEIVHAKAEKAIRLRKEKGTFSSAVDEITEIRRQSEYYIVKNLERLIDVLNEKITEMCVVVQVGNKTYGISVDDIDMITDKGEKLSDYARTLLSAGHVTIKSKEYNVLNLTKLANVFG